MSVTPPTWLIYCGWGVWWRRGLPRWELRELIRHRAKLVALRSSLKSGVHAVIAKQSLHLTIPTPTYGPSVFLSSEWNFSE